MTEPLSKKRRAIAATILTSIFLALGATMAALADSIVTAASGGHIAGAVVTAVQVVLDAITVATVIMVVGLAFPRPRIFRRKT